VGANLASKALLFGAPRVIDAGAAAAEVAGAAAAKVAAAAAANDALDSTPGLDLWDTVAMGFDGHESEVVEEGKGLHSLTSQLNFSAFMG